jgi:hypothetical protein
MLLHGHLAIFGAVVAEQPLPEATSFLVSRDLETRVGILMRSAWTPGRPPAISWRTPLGQALARLVLGSPETAPRKPHQHGIGMPRL